VALFEATSQCRTGIVPFTEEAQLADFWREKPLVAGK
jgi:hypothetical protein